MALERLLRLCISILRRVLDLKSCIQLPLKSLLWVISKLRRVVSLGRGALPFSATSPEGCKDLEIGYHGSFFCASRQPPLGEAGEQGILEPTHNSGLGTLSIQPSESNSSLPHRYSSTSPVPKLATTCPPTPTLEKFEQNLGFPRSDLCKELQNLNLLAIAPREYQRYDKNEFMCV